MAALTLNQFKYILQKDILGIIITCKFFYFYQQQLIRSLLFRGSLADKYVYSFCGKSSYIRFKQIETQIN